MSNKSNAQLVAAANRARVDQWVQDLTITNARMKSVFAEVDQLLAEIESENRSESCWLRFQSWLKRSFGR